MTQNKITEKIKIWGIVQGVGFRPFVAKLADRLGMKGEVLNIGGLVDVVLTDFPERIEAFLTALKKEKPVPAEIVHMKRERLPFRQFESFTILDSDEGDDEAAMIPADLAICPDCLAELQDENNPRYAHPFISCMICGPRYTIIDKIPYDRHNTVMIEFPMCEFCETEYTNRQDRRYHAQTISCHDCGPMLEYVLREELSLDPSKVDHNKIIDTDVDSNLNKTTNEDKIMKKAIKPISIASNLILSEGSVIALKGVGGYNLICSPFDEQAVKNLRRIKGREEKPFAVMFRDMDQIKEYCYLSTEEEKLLTSSARPIVLLERKNVIKCRKLIDDSKPAKPMKSMSDETYRSSRFMGAFLPSMGAQFMLLEQCGPLIVTSANLSDLPMIKEEDEILQLMNKEPLLSAVFYNRRKIRIRLDDSVARIIDGQPQMIRRAKGYAPVPLYINSGLGKEDMILATGGQLKSSFSLSKGSFAYVSQYFGDLDSSEAVSIYEKNIGRMESLFRIKPKLVVCDLHPLYNTTKFASMYAEKAMKQHSTVEVIQVQHHHAHVASVMAEHGLSGAVIGVAFDGTGYGTDGTIWGGEFLICEEDSFQRGAHLEYVSMLGGDSSMKEGWKSAMSYVYAYENKADKKEIQEDEIHLDLTEIIEFSKIKKHPNWNLVRAALDHGINKIQSSSMGRLFDAVAALLGIHDVNRYEGECAIMLENAAIEALRAPGLSKQNDMALKFHYDVAEMILNQCETLKQKFGINQVALTGGVFQNKVLMEKTVALLRQAKFDVYYNVSVSPNDGGICLGQNYIGMQHLKKRQKLDSSKENKI